MNNNTHENIYSLKGIKKVFFFTLKQTFKNKGYIFSFVLLVIIMAAMGPIFYLSEKSGESFSMDSVTLENSKLNKIYFSNDTDIEYDKNAVESLLVDGLDIKDAENISYEDLNASDVQEKTSSLTENECIVSIEKSETGFIIKGILAEKSDLEPSEIDDIVYEIQNDFDKARYKKAGISEEDLKLISSGISNKEVISEDSYFTKEKTGKSEKETSSGTIGYILVIFLVSIMSSSYIISSISEEKTSKLVETLLVNVRPMALVMGKIFAMLCYVAILLMSGILASKLTRFIMENVMNLDMSNTNSSGLDFTYFTDEGIKGIILLVIALLFAYILFAMLSGIMGSVCSKTEDIQSATGYVMTIIMICYFAAMFLEGTNPSPVVTHILALLPPISSFMAPTMFLSGQIPLWEIVLSFVLQLAAIVVLTRTCAKTYKVFLLKNIDKVSIGEIFKAIKNN